MENRSLPMRTLRVLLSLLLAWLVFYLSSWFFAAMCIMAGAMVVTAARGSFKEWMVWIGMLVGFALFAEIRARMGPTVELRTLFTYVIQMETLGGLWEVPTLWLQEHIPGSFMNAGGWLDAVTTAVYISFFIVPQVVVVYLWWKGGPFARYVLAACILFTVALAIHFLLPTAPPWMAAEEGLLRPIQRIGIRVLTETSPSLTAGGYEASANDVAAMPSVHLGLSVLAAMAMASFDPRTKRTAWVYSLAMLFAITYLGEHYAVDGVVGAAIAWGGWVGAGAFLAKRGPARGPAAGP